MRGVPTSLTVFLGLSTFGISGYFLYLVLRKEHQDDYEDIYANASKVTTLEVRVPKNSVRSLIGRKGKNIKLIQENSNAKINFKEEEGATDRICIVRGTAEACDIAKNLIEDFVKNEPVLESEDVWVPMGCIGNIIGRCGQHILEIRSMSGAKLTVNDDEKGYATKRITIKGTLEQINVAKSLIEDLVEETQESQRRIESSLSKREPRVSPKFQDCIKNSQKVESPVFEKIQAVSGQADYQFDVYVPALEDPSRFWIQIVGPKASELDCLVEQMTEYYSNPDNRATHALTRGEVGDIVAAPFPYDDKWYRAEVIGINGSDLEGFTTDLFYVDYGDIATLPCHNVVELRTDFLRLHFQAIECFLARVAPAGETWSEEAKDKFVQLTHLAQWQKLSAKINGYKTSEKVRAKRASSPVPGLDLFEITNERDIDVAEELVRLGMAVFTEEAAGSQWNTSHSTSEESGCCSEPSVPKPYQANGTAVNGVDVQPVVNGY